MQLANYDIGVIVGRFQVPVLHEAHISLIQEVINRHKKCIIFIGTTSVLGTKENPLDYASRAAMVNASFGDKVVTVPLPDYRSDKAWSENLDHQIHAVYPNGKVCLYGGRDSFIKYYKGKYDCREFPTHDYRPGKEIRAEVGKELINTEEFRRGVIHSTQNRYPIMYHVVDVAVLKKENDEYKILLGNKYGETQLRLIGGFSDNWETLETTCRREVMEEAGVNVEGKFHYIGSYKIDDWRYRGSTDKIISSFFYGFHTFGVPRSNDDLDNVGWHDLRCVHKDVEFSVVDNHRQLIKDLYKKLEEIV